MKPEQVTDEQLMELARTAHEKSQVGPFDLWRPDALIGEIRQFCKELIAAALNAMPDALLRELVKERGCVMVPEAVPEDAARTRREGRHARRAEPCRDGVRPRDC